MCESLPEKEFDFINDEQLATFDFLSVPEDSPEGYILKVDLECPAELHDVQSDYPLCPEAAVVQPEELSPYTISLAEKLGVKTSSCRKLVGTLNLKLYVRLGMRLTKIHRAISFTQSRWLKPYIDFNTDQRKKATNDFEKDFFKLMNNSIFGKTMVSDVVLVHASLLAFISLVCVCVCVCVYVFTCVTCAYAINCVVTCRVKQENIRKHQDVKLVFDTRKFRRLACKPNFKAFRIFNEDLVAVNMSKKVIRLTKPTYAGMSILDFSKAFMFAFHYDKIVAR